MTPSPLKYVDDNIYKLHAEERVVGNYIYDPTNQEVGRIRGLLVDPETCKPRYLLVVFGGMMFTSGKSVLIPRKHYKPIGMGKVRVNWSLQSLQQSPSVQSLKHLSREEEQIILSFFDLEPYWEPEEENAEA